MQVERIVTGGFMSRLTIYPDQSTDKQLDTESHAEIASELSSIGVRFEQWQAKAVLADDASQEDVLAAYQQDIDALMKEYNFQSADVVNLTPSHPDKKAFREKFLNEHTHSDFEVRFFVDGSGLFYIHANDKVYIVLCEKGDLISVPANTTHWFDMGENPFFKCIRLFTTPEGWVANFTGSDIASRYPSFEEYVA
jgi:1,2-dihydroxy-3-keto-5-methylthiopentene dioxygenase